MLRMQMVDNLVIVLLNLAVMIRGAELKLRVRLGIGGLEYTFAGPWRFAVDSCTLDDEMNGVVVA